MKQEDTLTGGYQLLLVGKGRMSNAIWCFLGASGLVCVLRSSTPLRELSLRANDLGDPIASQVQT
jgi:hypothetical protein